MPRKKILFLIGSPNQTTQMHQIASELAEFDCYFSQLYYDGPWLPLYHTVLQLGLLEKTIVSGYLKQHGDRYLAEHGLRNDYKAAIYSNKYDLVVACSDLILPQSLLDSTKTVFVQEGMTDQITWWSRVIKALKLPPTLAVGTSLNGTSNICDIYCVASPGYKQHFSKWGTDPNRIAVTGIPNFDNAQQFLRNDFPHRGYVMVATTDMRETFRPENRKKFIRQAARIADGRPMLFKLHPNEAMERAVAEIKRYAPVGTLIFTEGNTNHMIANCDELITQYSTVVYVGIGLGKKVHSFFDVAELKRMMPIQNGGQSARNIAVICRHFIDFNGRGEEFLKQYLPANQAREASAELLDQEEVNDRFH